MVGTDSRLRAEVLLLTQETLKKLYDFNQEDENWVVKDYAPGAKKKDDDQWGGGRARRLLQFAYAIAFTCLLRVDEVLKIQSHDIKLMTDDQGRDGLQLTLPFRKTEQFGGASNHAAVLLVLIISPCSHQAICGVQVA